MSAITTRRHTIDVTNPVEVRLTEIVAVNGSFQRAIRVYGEAEGVNGQPILEIVLTAPTSDAIEVMTPNLTF